MVNLSIIIPHYNSAKSLEKLLDSIPKSKDIEIIVVDDNSNKYLEEYYSIVNNIKYKDVIFKKNKSINKGAGACRNIGLELAKGNWLIFADSDDFFLENFYEYIKKYFNSKFDIIYFVPTSIETDSLKLADRHLEYEKMIYDYIKEKKMESELKLRCGFFVPWSKMIKSELIKNNNIKFDETIASNDVMFSTKIGYYANEIEAVKEKIYCVTRSKGTLTTTITPDIFDARLSVHIRYCKFIQSNFSEDYHKYFKMRGIGFIVTAIKGRLGIKRIVSTYIKLKKENLITLK